LLFVDFGSVCGLHALVARDKRATFRFKCTFVEHDQLLAAGHVSALFSGEAGENRMARSARIAAADFSASEREDAMAEVRQLITDLRDAAQDGRALARRYADVLTSVVDEYCLEFEKRAEAALARLETVE
jgi:hypothetical protein